jgi:hypothetical protein
MSVQDNYLKTTDGFFAWVTLRQDAVEEITVSSATPGATRRQGAVQIKVRHRSGSNMFKGTAYEHTATRSSTRTTTSTFRTCRRTKITLHQHGASEGGPIVLPGMDGHGKAFFFIQLPKSSISRPVTRTRTIMNPLTQSGIFQYTVAGAVRTVDPHCVAARGQWPDDGAGSHDERPAGEHRRRGENDRNDQAEQRSQHDVVRVAACVGEPPAPADRPGRLQRQHREPSDRELHAVDSGVEAGPAERRRSDLSGIQRNRQSDLVSKHGAVDPALDAVATYRQRGAVRRGLGTDVFLER